MSVQNAAAGLIFTARRQDHVQPLLRSLHWLCVQKLISFQLAVLVHRCLHGSAPGYPASVLQHVSWPQCTSEKALFKYVSTCRSTHHARYHQQPCLPGSWHICLEQSARVSWGITITASFLQLTKDWAFSCLTAVLTITINYVMYQLLCDSILSCPCSLSTTCHVKINSFINIIIRSK